MEKLFNTGGRMKNLYSLIIISVGMFICNLNCQTKSEITSILNSRQKLLYIEAIENHLKGNLVLLDIEQNKKVKIISDIFDSTHPRISPDRKYIMYFKSYMPAFKPVFVLYDLEHESEKLIDLTKILPPETASLDGLMGFEFLNDSSIVFNYKDKLYKYNFIVDSLTMIKDLKNRKVMEMSVDQKGMKIALGCQMGLDSLNYIKFAVYDLKKDSILYFDQNLYYLKSNWSPDGTEIMLSNGPDSVIFFNNKDKTFTTYDNTVFAPGIYSGKVIYMTNDTVIYNECLPNYNLYYYDLRNRKLIRKLTNDYLKRPESSLSKVE